MGHHELSAEPGQLKPTDPKLTMLVHLLTGGKLRAHLCSKAPAGKVMLLAYSLGTGLLSAEGGLFRIKRSGRAVCIAWEFEGKLVISTPSLCPINVVRGTEARIGRIVSNVKGMPDGTAPQA